MRRLVMRQCAVSCVLRRLFRGHSLQQGSAACRVRLGFDHVSQVRIFAQAKGNHESRLKWPKTSVQACACAHSSRWLFHSTRACAHKKYSKGIPLEDPSCCAKTNVDTLTLKTVKHNLHYPEVSSLSIGPEIEDTMYDSATIVCCWGGQWMLVSCCAAAPHVEKRVVDDSAHNSRTAFVGRPHWTAAVVVVGHWSPACRWSTIQWQCSIPNSARTKCRRR
jgi:hypothetical protein